MQTASVKRARRAGRPRNRAKRYPNGTVYRHDIREREADALFTALDARVRQGKAATLAEARDPRSATALGRLLRDGVISPAQHLAGLTYEQRYRRNLLACDAPPPHPRCPDSAGRSRGDIDAETIARWRAEWKAACGALAQAGHAAQSDVRAVTLDDFSPSSIAAFRLGLKFLAQEFGIIIDDAKTAA